jgi:hypothetical protein
MFKAATLALRFEKIAAISSTDRLAPSKFTFQLENAATTPVSMVPS